MGTAKGQLLSAPGHCRCGCPAHAQGFMLCSEGSRSSSQRERDIADGDGFPVSRGLPANVFATAVLVRVASAAHSLQAGAVTANYAGQVRAEASLQSGTQASQASSSTGRQAAAQQWRAWQVARSGFLDFVCKVWPYAVGPSAAS